MKNVLLILTIFLTVFISSTASGQNEGALEDLYMSGKWTGSCAIEIIDKATIRSCELCAFVIDPNDKSIGVSKDVDMTFLPDSITFNQNGKSTTIPYKRNKDDHSFSFTLNKKEYHFRMFLYNDQRIIEDKDGLLLVLNPAKNNK